MDDLRWLIHGRMGLDGTGRRDGIRSDGKISKTKIDCSYDCMLHSIYIYITRPKIIVISISVKCFEINSSSIEHNGCSFVFGAHTLLEGNDASTLSFVWYCRR